MHTSSQCRCDCVGREQDLGMSTGLQLVPSHLNHPVSTSELDSCSPNPQCRICVDSGFSHWYLLNALRFAALCTFSFYSVDLLGIQASRRKVYLDKLFLESSSVFRLHIRGSGPLKNHAGEHLAMPFSPSSYSFYVLSIAARQMWRIKFWICICHFSREC